MDITAFIKADDSVLQFVRDHSPHAAIAAGMLGVRDWLDAIAAAREAQHQARLQQFEHMVAAAEHPELEEIRQLEIRLAILGAVVDAPGTRKDVLARAKRLSKSGGKRVSKLIGEGFILLAGRSVLHPTSKTRGELVRIENRLHDLRSITEGK